MKSLFVNRGNDCQPPVRWEVLLCKLHIRFDWNTAQIKRGSLKGSGYNSVVFALPAPHGNDKTGQ